jgi:hypothetical protein
MVIARCFTATAFLAGLGLGLAAPADAWGPAGPAPIPAVFQNTGHYTESQTDPSNGQTILVNGQPLQNNWYFTPCGDGCAAVAAAPGGPTLGQAQLLANGQWTLNTTDDLDCADGSHISNALAAHRTWDPNSLAGTVQTTWDVAACGTPAGNTTNFNLQLQPAP